MKRKSNNLLLKVALAACCFVALSSLSLAADNIFISVDGMNGESAESGHVGWIGAFAYSDGIVAGSTEIGSGRADFHDLKIRKHIDKTSPKLRLYAATGTHINTVKIDIMRTDGSGTLMERVILNDVIVSEIAATVLEGNAVEDVSFNYGKITWSYQAQNGTTNRSCFDRETNTQCNTGSGAAVADKSE